jgi:hypothetical protein
MKNNVKSLQFAGNELKSDVELVWISMKYFKTIKQMEKCLDVNFTFK